MKATYDVRARKRPVNLTLNEDLVTQARGVTNNLSGVVESLLADFLAREKQQRADEVRALKQPLPPGTASRKSRAHSPTSIRRSEWRNSTSRILFIASSPALSSTQRSIHSAALADDQ